MNRTPIKPMHVLCTAMTLAAGLAWAGHADAAIMWVEVDGTLTDGSTPDNDNTTGTITAADGSANGDADTWEEWPNSAPSGANQPQIGSIALIAQNDEDAGQLTSTLNLELDTDVDYNFFVLFRSSEFTGTAGTDQEGIQVKLASDASFQSFDRNSPGAQQFGSSTYYFAQFATVTGLAGTDTVTVNVDQFDTLIDGQFTIYDAIGFEVVPEPASLALLGLGGVVMLSGRRRR